ncbi:hypothetical protein [Devosia sp. Leaf64]
MYSPPGSGKTSLAKTIEHEVSALRLTSVSDVPVTPWARSSKGAIR